MTYETLEAKRSEVAKMATREEREAAGGWPVMPKVLYSPLRFDELLWRWRLQDAGAYFGSAVRERAGRPV